MEYKDANYLTTCSRYFEKIDRLVQYLGNYLSIGENFIVLCERKVGLIPSSKNSPFVPSYPPLSQVSRLYGIQYSWKDCTEVYIYRENPYLKIKLK